MIRKLRRKFVLINMLFVSAVLLAVFATLCLSTYRTRLSCRFSVSGRGRTALSPTSTGRR